MADILRRGDIGQAVTDLQAALQAAGFTLERTGIYDEATETAVRALQRVSGLVVDGRYGPKSKAALQRLDTRRLLRERDLQDAAERLGVPLASIKAVNEVESAGSGFLEDGRPKILFERHVFYNRLGEHGLDPGPYAERYPSLVNPKRGGYAGGTAEYTRLASAEAICRPAALEAASWGSFQIMGYHWRNLGYEGIEVFVQAQGMGETQQLDAFVRFLLADRALLRALRARRWAEFARRYNGPAYAANLYDVKLARAFDRFAGQELELQA
ncbi:N-acetylmuramidase domain-containing protein [Bordetella sp. 2513F-2]